jgi:3-phenylpropionate/trans-cinnamate dioxygenase ferredoxin reductase subunit
VSEKSPRIVIIGAGHAGGAAAALLRQYGHSGEIVLIGDELIAPYQRPPLSKAYLKGEVDAETLKLKPDEFYADQGVTLRLGTTVEAIDRAGGRVSLRGGGDVAYDRLIIATGSSNRKLTLPSALPHQLHELRSVADAEQLKAVLEHGKRLAIIGGGYIGLEAAASARALGAEAVILELAPRVLARVACPELSGFFEAYHRARGVQILTGVQVVDLEHGEGGHVSGVRLADGAVIACDVALVGVGAMACSQLAADAGLSCENGVVVDAAARTSDPAIYAIGDVTWRPMPLYGDRMHRLESVPNALEQAKQAVCDILGRPQPAPETPWFWSDQYDLKLQIAGVPFDADDVAIRGSVEDARFAIFHLKGDRILAVEAVNAPSEFMAGRLMIGQGKPVDRARLIDPAVSMKQVALG